MITTRFAPSPTGHLHLGHAWSAHMAWQRARRSGGRFLLRIEDIDATRCRPEFTAAILDDLRWLGLDWDGLRIQSKHEAAHRAALDRLAAMGLTYPCFCSRADIAAAVAAPHGPDGPVYPGICRTLPEPVRHARIQAGERFAVRLDMAQAAARAGPLSFTDDVQGTIACAPMRWGDVVLARKDTPASYHLCATHDDAAQGVDLVVRGEDLLAATDIQRVLQALLGWPTPRYAHHALITDANGRRLAKRDRATTLRALREAGQTPAQLRAWLTAGSAPSMPPAAPPSPG